MAALPHRLRHLLGLLRVAERHEVSEGPGGKLALRVSQGDGTRIAMLTPEELAAIMACLYE